MKPAVSGEVHRTSRRQALIPLGIGVVFLGIGLWAVSTIWTNGDRTFAWFWGSFRFLGSSAAAVNGLMGLRTPPVHAVLSADGLALPFLRATQIPWSHILDVRLAPGKLTDSEGTHHVFKEPLIRRMRDLAPLQTGKAARWTQGMTAPLEDGTVEFMVQTLSCPLPANELLARIQSRLLGEPVPVLPAAADAAVSTFGGRLISPPPPNLRVHMDKISALVTCLIGAAIVAFGAHQWKRGHDALNWTRAHAFLKHADVTESSDRRSTYRGIRVHYEFTRQGWTYTGADLDVSSNDGSKDYVESKLGEYPAGQRFTVYFDPQNPADSAFHPPAKRVAYEWLGGGAAFLVFGFFLWRFRVRRT